MSLKRGILARFVANARSERLTVKVYAALVDQLFGGGAAAGYMMLVVAAMIMAIVAYGNRPNFTTLVMLDIMSAIFVGRIVLLVRYRRWRAVGSRRATLIAAWEAAYAILGALMGLMIGLVSAYNTLTDADSSAMIVTIIVVMGVAGGVTSRNGSRPRIVFAQITAVMVPFCLALMAAGSRLDLIIAILFTIYFLATYLSTKAFYGSLRTAMSSNERSDALKVRVQRTAMCFDTALNTMSSGLLMFDDRMRLVVANDRVKTLWGKAFVDGLLDATFPVVSREVVKGLAIPRATSLALSRRVQTAVASGGELDFLIDDHVRHRCYGMRLSRTAGGGIVVVIDDVTEKHKQDEEIFRLAHQDALTGMANRLDLSRQMATMISRAGTDVRSVAMYIDLDGFKSVNDYFGHGVGDRLLVRVAKRIAAATRAVDLTARIGGDEFVVCFREIENVDDVSRIAGRLLSELARPYVIDEKTIEIGASAGLALIASSDTEPEEVLRLADVALYKAKTSGRGQAVWFTPEMDDRAREHRQMTQELREAIETGCLVLHYQPITDYRTGRIVCCEALARWTSPTRGIVSPSVFIPLAEESDLIHKLGHWSLAQACHDAQSWPDPTIKVAVNLSPAQFKAEHISRTVADLVSASGLSIDRLEIEITESVLADDLDAMTAELEALHATGVSIALDDFGAGYSSLGLLHTLPIQKVKLDQSFVRKLDVDPSAIALVSSIVQMANIMRKELVIEGVETAEHLALVGQANARLIQGFYFSRPMPNESLIAYMTDRSMPWHNEPRVKTA